MDKQDVYVYSTTPSGDPDTWSWDYNGKLVDANVAAELGGEKITQTDIALGTDGQLLLIGTPDDWDDTLEDFNHKGCVVVEIGSLEAPSLKRDSSGNLIVRARITASDSNELGSGASTYDPNSETGILFTKRVKTSSSLTVSIRKSGLKP